MIPSDYTDIETTGSEAHARLGEALGRAYRSGSVPSRVDLAVRAATQAPRATRPSRRHLPSLGTWPVRAVAAGAAALLIAGGAAFHLHGGGATPVSAATVLKRAVTADLVPNQVSHLTYRLTSSIGDAETSNVWVGADASGDPTRLAMDLAGSAGGKLIERLVDSGQGIELYDAQTNTVTEPVKDLSNRPWSAMVLGTRVAAKLGGVAALPSDRQKRFADAITEGTLDRASVYILRISPNSGDPNALYFTFYIDAQSYDLRGADWTQGGASWQARLESVQTVPAASVPANTFTLNAPADAKVVKIATEDTGPKVSIEAAFAAVCNVTGQVSKPVGGVQSGGMLAVCRQTNPSITRDQFLAGMSAQLKSQLDAAVAAGKLTAKQAATELDGMMAKITQSL